MHAPWRRAQYGRLAATLLAVMLCSALGAAAAERDAPLGIRVFSNPRHPPTYQGSLARCSASRRSAGGIQYAVRPGGHPWGRAYRRSGTLIQCRVLRRMP